MTSKIFTLAVAITAGLISVGCSSLQTNSRVYILVRPYGLQKPTPTVIMAHGCDGFFYDKGRGYRNKANLIGRPLIPTLVHLGEADHWTPMRFCLRYQDQPHYTMHIYKGATHAWESGVNTIAIGKWPIRFDLEATHTSEERTRDFL